MELPEEMSRLNSLQELVFRFSARKMLRCVSFALPCSLTTLDLSGTPIRSLPESIKGLGLLILNVTNCRMLEALPQLPSYLGLLCVSFCYSLHFCYSLQILANPDCWTVAEDCDHLVEFQDRIKQELIQEFDSYIFRIMKTMIFKHGIFNVVVYGLDEDEMLFCVEGEEDKWLIQNEFVVNFSFKISSSSPVHRICGFNLFARFSLTLGCRCEYPFNFEIRNNTSGLSMLCLAFVFRSSYECGVVELQSLFHTKLGVGDPTFDDGDDVSISMLEHDPAIQIRTIGVQWLHEEEGKDDDDIQSKDEVINAHNSSGGGGGAAHAAKVEIASCIFRNYYCALHARNYYCESIANLDDDNFGCWYFAKRGL